MGTCYKPERHDRAWRDPEDSRVTPSAGGFPDLPVDRIRLGIDSSLFFPPSEGKRKSLAFMPRRNRQELVQLLRILGLRRALAGLEGGAPIDNVSEAGAAVFCGHRRSSCRSADRKASASPHWKPWRAGASSSAITAAVVESSFDLESAIPLTRLIFPARALSKTFLPHGTRAARLWRAWDNGPRPLRGGSTAKNRKPATCFAFSATLLTQSLAVSPVRRKS